MRVVGCPGERPDRRLSPSNPSRLSPPAGSLPPRCFTGVRAQTSGIPAWRRPSRMRSLSVGRSGLPLAAGSRSAVRRTGEPSYPVPLPYIPPNTAWLSRNYRQALRRLPALPCRGDNQGCSPSSGTGRPLPPHRAPIASELDQGFSARSSVPGPVAQSHRHGETTPPPHASLEIELVQSHFLTCSVPFPYKLWARRDYAQSGLRWQHAERRVRF